MQSETPPVGFLFPGQGAQCPEMLDGFRGDPEFPAIMAAASSHLGVDLLADGAISPALLASNLGSSLLTVAASLVALARLQREGMRPSAVAGYSVGQWVALHAAGMVGRDDLFDIIALRARLMDAAVQAFGPCGMLAVIGVARPVLGEICFEAEKSGFLLEISNENAPGQFTLSGDGAGLALAEEKLPAFHPRRLKRLAVEGAWHGRILAPAAAQFAALIAGRPLAKARLPVIDNTSGGWLPPAPPPELLARQLAAPVLWMQGIRTMADFGIMTFLETGYGDLLSRFGFFIDRSRRFVPVIAPARGAH